MDNVLVEQIKKELVQTIECLKLEHLDEHKKVIKKYFDVLENIKGLEKKKRSLQGVLADNTRQIQEDASIENTERSNVEAETTDFKEKKSDSIKSEDKEIEDDKIHNSLDIAKNKMYLFERKIRGGFVPEIDGFVPEKVIRDLGLKHHDYVYAIEDGYANGDMKKYQYSLAKRTEKPVDDNRVQVNLCPIEKDGNMLVVRKSLEDGRDIKFGEVPYSFLLNVDEVIDLKLKEEMIVDIAYPADKPDRVKVIWIYDVRDSEPEATLVFQSKRTASKKEEKHVEEDEIVIDEDALKGKSILIIGNEPKKAIYKASIEQRGGSFLWADARSHVTILEPLVKKSDMVIFLLKVSKHVAMKQIKALCKERDIPFLTTFSTGKSTIVKMAEETEV
ncbi:MULTISPECIES: DUF2325 domain-containing protein [unclassified Bacillus (in: firmicutes)]|uniref:DUF2325 domain-containing protein n=1 Tax=unclassified Bacillus (in: firmicutes) TaxID=185979 RepID=UPI0030102A86